MQFSYKQCKAFPRVAEFLNSTEEILLMLKWCFPCQSKTYEPYSEQLVNLGCVLFCLLEISYFRAQLIMSYTKEVRSFTILFVGLFKFTLMFDKVQLCATRLVFLLKVRSKLDSVFSLYQSQTQSTMPDLVKTHRQKRLTHRFIDKKNPWGKWINFSRQRFTTSRRSDISTP